VPGQRRAKEGASGVRSIQVTTSIFCHYQYIGDAAL
jgi:hypothetical protein